MSLTLGKRSPALLRWLSRNFASAASSNAVHVSTYPFPGFTSLNEPSCLYLGSFQAAAAILLPSFGYGATTNPYGSPCQKDWIFWTTLDPTCPYWRTIPPCSRLWTRIVSWIGWS